jgi:chromosome partitioning protein
MARIRPGIVIAVGNQKGGVGKSTNTVHLAAALGERGYSSVVIDLDPSAGSTKHLGVPPDSFAGTLELLTTEETPETLAVTERLPEGVHLIPARGELAELDSLLSKFVDKTHILDRPIALARPLYDFIFLDTPPNPAATTTVAAYSVAEWFLLSAFPHPLSIGGLNEALKDIADVRARRNPNLEVLGVVVTAVDARSNLWREVDELVTRELPGRRFRTMISQAIEIAKCSGRGKTVLQIRGSERNVVANQYRKLASEIEERVLHREEFLSGEFRRDEPAPDATAPAAESVTEHLLVVND